MLDTGLVSRFILVCTRCVTSERMILTINGNKENLLFDLTSKLLLDRPRVSLYTFYRENKLEINSL